MRELMNEISNTIKHRNLNNTRITRIKKWLYLKNIGINMIVNIRILVKNWFYWKNINNEKYRTKSRALWNTTGIYIYIYIYIFTIVRDIMGFIIKIYENIINYQIKGSFGTMTRKIYLRIRTLIFINNSIGHTVINKLSGHNSFWDLRYVGMITGILDDNLIH